MRAEGPRLTPREARLLRELATVPGTPVSIWELADAVGFAKDAWETKSDGHTLPKACDRTYSLLQSIKRKFGEGVIENVHGQGYRLSPAALKAVRL